MNTLEQSNFKNALFLKLIIFLLNPVCGLLYSLRKSATNSSYVIYYLFGVLFAWVMDYHGDALDYCRLVPLFYEYNFTLPQFIDEILLFFSGESHLSDLYFASLAFITHFFSDNYHAFFTLASIIFMYYMLASLKFVTNDELRYDEGCYCIVILFLFVLPYNIFYIEAPRFPTALWMGMYATLKLFYEDKKKYFVLLFFTPIIHAAFTFYVLVVVAFFLFFRNSSKLPILYFISLPFIALSFDWISTIDFSFLPSFLDRMVNAYLSDEAFEKWGDIIHDEGTGFHWVQVMFEILRLCVYPAAIILLIKNSSTFLQDTFSKFALFYLSIVNFVSFVPVLGGRMREFSYIFIILLWFKYMDSLRLQKFLYLILFANFYEIFIKYRMFVLDVIDSEFFYSNTLYLIYKNLNVFSY